MFTDIKDHLDNPVVREILAECVFDNSPEGLDNKAAEYRRKESWHLYGWVEDGEILGVCGFEAHTDWVEILHIAVARHAQRHGIGGAMVRALRETYKITVEAETDDDAVEFYRKCGFETTAMQKYNVRRWVCVLHPAKNST